MTLTTLPQDQPRPRTVRLAAAVTLASSLTVFQAIWPLYVSRWAVALCVGGLLMLGGVAGYRLAVFRTRRVIARMRVSIAIWRARALSAEAEREIRTVLNEVRAEVKTVAALPPPDAAPSGDELRRRREALGASQSDLAAAAYLSRSAVSEIERGRRGNPLTRLRLSETLNAIAGRQP